MLLAVRLHLGCETPGFPFVNWVRMHLFYIFNIFSEALQFLLGSEGDFAPLKMVVDLVLVSSQDQILTKIVLVVNFGCT